MTTVARKRFQGRAYGDYRVVSGFQRVSLGYEEIPGILQWHPFEFHEVAFKAISKPPRELQREPGGLKGGGVTGGFQEAFHSFQGV